MIVTFILAFFGSTLDEGFRIFVSLYFFPSKELKIICLISIVFDINSVPKEIINIAIKP